jgi:hypothetical protein
MEAKTMAKVANNIFVRGLSGKLGGQFVLRRLRDGRTIVCNIPDFSNRKLSRDQKNHHKRFKMASAYAKSASRSNPIYAQLAKGTMKNAYNVALGDWFHPPVIHAVERRGKVIRAQVTDDVMVASVQMMILNDKGKVLEKGEAIRKKGPSTGSGWWEYAPAAEGKVMIEAQDLAGNVVKAEMGD